MVCGLLFFVFGRPVNCVANGANLMLHGPQVMIQNRRPCETLVTHQLQPCRNSPQMQNAIQFCRVLRPSLGRLTSDRREYLFLRCRCGQPKGSASRIGQRVQQAPLKLRRLLLDEDAVVLQRCLNPSQGGGYGFKA